MVGFAGTSGIGGIGGTSDDVGTYQEYYITQSTSATRGFGGDMRIWEYGCSGAVMERNVGETGGVEDEGIL